MPSKAKPSLTFLISSKNSLSIFCSSFHARLSSTNRTFLLVDKFFPCHFLSDTISRQQYILRSLGLKENVVELSLEWKCFPLHTSNNYIVGSGITPVYLSRKGHNHCNKHELYWKIDLGGKWMYKLHVNSFAIYLNQEAYPASWMKKKHPWTSYLQYEDAPSSWEPAHMLGKKAWNCDTMVPDFASATHPCLCPQ